MHKAEGMHAVIDGVIPRVSLLNDGAALCSLLRSSVEKAGATILAEHIERFEPQGVTVVLVLAESHASVHTYPEYGVYMADVFTCGGLDAEKAGREFAEQLGGAYTLRTIARGMQS